MVTETGKSTSPKNGSFFEKRGQNIWDVCYSTDQEDYLGWKWPDMLGHETSLEHQDCVSRELAEDRIKSSYVLTGFNQQALTIEIVDQTREWESYQVPWEPTWAAETFGRPDAVREVRSDWTVSQSDLEKPTLVQSWSDEELSGVHPGFQLHPAAQTPPTNISDNAEICLGLDVDHGTACLDYTISCSCRHDSEGFDYSGSNGTFTDLSPGTIYSESPASAMPVNSTESRPLSCARTGDNAGHQSVWDYQWPEDADISFEEISQEQSSSTAQFVAGALTHTSGLFTEIQKPPDHVTKLGPSAHQEVGSDFAMLSTGGSRFLFSGLAELQGPETLIAGRILPYESEHWTSLRNPDLSQLQVMSEETQVDNNFHHHQPSSEHCRLYHSQHIPPRLVQQRHNNAERIIAPRSWPGRRKIQRSRIQPSPRTQPRADAKDVFLVQSKLAGMSYKEIRDRGNFSEAESTLRGRFRTLTKEKENRVRKPEWEERDVRAVNNLAS